MLLTFFFHDTLLHPHSHHINAHTLSQLIYMLISMKNNRQQTSSFMESFALACNFSSKISLLLLLLPPTYIPHQLLSRANHKKNFFFPFTLLLSSLSFLAAHLTHPTYVASSKSKTRNMNRTTKTFSHKHESALMYKSKRKPLNKTYFCLTNNTRVKAIVQKELFPLNT